MTARASLTEQPDVDVPARVPTTEIVAAYRETGSVWKAGKRVGISGQKVWDRLRAIGHPLSAARWTAEEVDELRRLAVTACTIAQMARRLGRPYSGVACKLSSLGLTERHAPKQGVLGMRVRKSLRGTGFTARSTRKVARELRAFSGSLRQFAKQRSCRLELMVKAIQRYEPAFWTEWTKSHGLPEIPCPYCGVMFHPMTKKQRNCTRECAAAARVDRAYFGGKRRNAHGLVEGVCQLCERHLEKGLSAHHIFGKANDPENENLIALCPGCHKIIGMLASRTAVPVPEFWENLIHLTYARWAAERGPVAEFHGTYISVEIARLTQEYIDELEEKGSDATA